MHQMFFKICLKTKHYLNLTSSNFAITSHINYWDQVNFWKKFWKFWNDPSCRNKSAPFPLRNVVAYWKNINTEACANKLSQTLANNLHHRGWGLFSEFMWGIIEDQNIKVCLSILKKIAIIVGYIFAASLKRSSRLGSWRQKVWESSEFPIYTRRLETNQEKLTVSKMRNLCARLPFLKLAH